MPRRMRRCSRRQWILPRDWPPPLRPVGWTWAIWVGGRADFLRLPRPTNNYLSSRRADLRGAALAAVFESPRSVKAAPDHRRRAMVNAAAQRSAAAQERTTT